MQVITARRRVRCLSGADLYLGVQQIRDMRRAFPGEQVRSAGCFELRLRGGVQDAAARHHEHLLVLLLNRLSSKVLM